VRAAARAKDEGAVLLAESTCRFLRAANYNHKTNRNAKPTTQDFRDLLRLTGNVTLATRLHPDASQHKVRSRQTKRGHKTQGQKGGRPPKDSTPTLFQPDLMRVLELLDEHDGLVTPREVMQGHRRCRNSAAATAAYLKAIGLVESKRPTGGRPSTVFVFPTGNKTRPSKASRSHKKVGENKGPAQSGTSSPSLPKLSVRRPLLPPAVKKGKTKGTT
jgi:hypothetical protein